MLRQFGRAWDHAATCCSLRQAGKNFVAAQHSFQPSPLSVLSGALKISDKFTIAMEAVGDKIRMNSQGWDDARVLTERQVAMVVASGSAAG